MSKKFYNSAGELELELAETLDELPWFQEVLRQSHDHLLRTYAYNRKDIPSYLHLDEAELDSMCETLYSEFRAKQSRID